MIKRNKKKSGNSQTAEKAFIAQVRNALFENDNSNYREIVDRIMDDTGETAAEIAAALVGMALKAPAADKKKQAPPPKPKNAPVKITEKPKPVPAKAVAKEKTVKSAMSKTVRLSINGGLNKHFTHKDIVGALIARAGLRGADMKEIQIGERQTFLQVSSRHASKILSVMNTPEGKIKGVPVKVQICKERKK